MAYWFQSAASSHASGSDCGVSLSTRPPDFFHLSNKYRRQVQLTSIRSIDLLTSSTRGGSKIFVAGYWFGMGIRPLVFVSVHGGFHVQILAGVQDLRAGGKPKGQFVPSQRCTVSDRARKRGTVSHGRSVITPSGRQHRPSALQSVRA